jgi:hypothetical protein
MRINDEYLNSLSHDEYLFKVDTYTDSSWLGHAPFLKYLVRETKPEVFVELGVHNGFSYFVSCQSVAENKLNTRCFAIDHWQGDSHVGNLDEKIYRNVESLNSMYSDFSTLIKKDFDTALADFSDNSIDLLHIDGHHSYESICKDFTTWLPKMTNSGVILIHDIFVHRTTFGVFSFWKEIKEKYKTLEFTYSHGLGIVFIGEIPTATLKALHEYSTLGDGMSQIAGTFGSIADDVIQLAGIRKSSGPLAERDSAVAERDSAVAERDSAVAERDSAVAERDSAVAERNLVLNSTIWRISSPYRKVKNLFRKN